MATITLGLISPFILVVSFFSASSALAGDTRIGSGETFYYILENTRRRLVTTLDLLGQDPDAIHKEIKYCDGPRSDLPLIKSQLCARFIESTRLKMREIAERVELTVRDENLYDGGLHVGAMTQPVETGPIIFSYPAAHSLPNDALLMLLAHEVAHKVAFDVAPGADAGPRNIDDEEDPQLASLGWRNGREFIDTIMGALAEYARERQLISNEAPVVLDLFRCTVQQEGFLAIDEMYISQPRVYTARTDVSIGDPYAHYQAGFGFTASTSYISGSKMLQISEGVNAWLELLIEEDTDCAIGKTSQRKSYLMLRRSNESPAFPAEVVESPLNPICRPPNSSVTAVFHPAPEIALKVSCGHQSEVIN